MPYKQIKEFSFDNWIVKARSLEQAKKKIKDILKREKESEKELEISIKRFNKAVKKNNINLNNNQHA